MNILTAATWNVRTLVDLDRLEEVIQDMENLKIGILGLSEMRWKGSGDSMSVQGYKIIYSGGDKHEKGVGFIIGPEKARAVKGYWAISDRIILVKIRATPVDINFIQVYAPTSTSSEEDIEDFYSGLDDVVRQCKHHEVLIVIGHFNAKVGNMETYGVTGKFGLGERNVRGEKLVEWAEVNNLVVGNTLFKQHTRRLWTWESPGNNIRNQIDYIMINRRYKSALLSVKTRPAAKGFSDHIPVVGNIRVNLKNMKRPPKIMKLNVGILKSDIEMRQRYNIAVQNRYSAVTLSNTIDSQWNMLKDSLQQTSKEIIPVVTKKIHKEWMTDDILQIMDRRRQKKGDIQMNIIN